MAKFKPYVRFWSFGNKTLEFQKDWFEPFPRDEGPNPGIFRWYKTRIYFQLLGFRIERMRRKFDHWGFGIYWSGRTGNYLHLEFTDCRHSEDQR